MSLRGQLHKSGRMIINFLRDLQEVIVFGFRRRLEEFELGALIVPKRFRDFAIHFHHDKSGAILRDLLDGSFGLRVGNFGVFFLKNDLDS
jgi:hypothetical protein